MLITNESVIIINVNIVNFEQAHYFIYFSLYE